MDGIALILAMAAAIWAVRMWGLGGIEGLIVGLVITIFFQAMINEALGYAVQSFRDIFQVLFSPSALVAALLLGIAIVLMRQIRNR